MADLHQSGPAHYRAKRDSKMSENRVFKISSVDRNASCTSVSGLLGQAAPQASCCKVLSEARKQKPERNSMTKFLYSRSKIPTNCVFDQYTVTTLN